MDRFLIHPVIISKPQTKQQLINTTPFRSFKVEFLPDDFYTNLISWSNEHICFGVSNKLELIHYYSSQSLLIKEFVNKSITCVQFNSTGKLISVGDVCGKLDVVNLEKKSNCVYKMHKGRIGVIEWDNNFVFTGSRDKSIKMLDLRSGESKTLLRHNQEICGLKLNCTKQLIASGGNDNLIYIYDLRNTSNPLIQLKSHKAAIKALTWSPLNPYLLLTGGGTADKCIKLWDVEKKPKLLKSLDTNSQVCNLYWCMNNTIISTHGYSQNDSRVFDSCFNQVMSNRGHKNRIIHFAMNREESCYVTGSSDNMVNVWRVPGNE